MISTDNQSSVLQLPNGLTLLTEPMRDVKSVSWGLLIPCGPIYEPVRRAGLSALTCEMTIRGAGSRNSREMLRAFENIGCETSESVGIAHTAFSASLLAEGLVPSLELLRDTVRLPHLPEDQLNAAKQVVLQDVYALEDDPYQKMMLELQRNFFPDPWGRSSIGNEKSVVRTSIEDVRQYHADFYQPQGAILSIAGNFDRQTVLDTVGELFGDWMPRKVPRIREKRRETPVVHLPYESTQTQIGVAFPCPPMNSPEYLHAWSSVSVLSGGMSNRLFNELREKRGLCYNAFAAYVTLKDRAGVFSYCGTGSDRAEEALDVLVRELIRLREGIDAAELDLVKIRAKSSLVMQQESTGSRCGSMARDWYQLGRVRSMQEIEAALDALSKKELNDYLASHPAGPFHIVTLGPEPVVGFCANS